MLSIELEFDNSTNINIEMKEVLKIIEDDYAKLKNKPRLNGVEIVGDMEEMDPTVPSWAKQKNKPTYTPEELGAVSDENIITLDEIDAIFRGI